VWLRRLLADLTKKEVQKVSLKIDNQAAISLCKNPVHHERSKHIDTRFHYIRECVEEGMLKVQHVNTNDQLADILTKSLEKQKFIEMRKKVGVEDVKQGNKVTEVNVDGNLVVVRIGVDLGSSTSPSRLGCLFLI
jgi:2-polyprenyl-6-methoxyphenol hydroxylase-like FAD-dependent oxidoreductase